MPSPDAPLSKPLSGDLIKALPLNKITGPGTVLLASMIIMGVVFTYLYTVNALAGIKNGFPTMAAWWTYFAGYLTVTAVYLGLSIYHFKENVKTVK